MVFARALVGATFVMCIVSAICFKTKESWKDFALAIILLGVFTVAI